MPKPSTFKTIFDDCLMLNISNFKKWNYLVYDTRQSGTLTWSNRFDEVTSRLTVQMVFNENEQYFYLNYKCNGNSYYYKVVLTSIPSNLGKGKVWYFICPFTLRRCRKLYLISERFMHRSNLPSGMYECQTKSKKWRAMEKAYGAYFDLDRHYKQLYSKYFKTHYNGMPTKKYIKIMQQINEGNQMSSSEIERLYIS